MISQSETTTTQQSIKSMLKTIKKVNHFSTDENDEFSLKLPEGALGIFKTWAFPIIPLLEQLSFEETTNLLSASNNTDALSEFEAKWHQMIESKPRLFAQTLERWRSFSETWDRRLFQVFASRELPTDKAERFSELFLRLELAFAMASAFYNIEALIVDPRETSLTPLLESDRPGGVLDVVSMMLPSALRERVIADRLNWNGLNWGMVAQIAHDLTDDEFAVVCQIADLAEADVESVIFAANVLEWIPANVGGKKNDINPEEALSFLNQLLSQDQHTDGHGLVAKNMNSLIRFHNWMPLIRDTRNFETASAWRYAAVCDTTNELMAFLETNQVLNPGMMEIFTDEILPQLQNLDATSARGRFILQLVQTNLIAPEIQEAITNNRDNFLDEVTASLEEFKNQESVIDIFDPKPRSIVGGKAFGIRQTAEILGQEKVAPGKVITAEAVEDLLRDNSIWDVLIEMDRLEDFNSLLSKASEVRQKLNSLLVPDEIEATLQDQFRGKSLVVRSSSADEDTTWSTAAGIYESEVGVDPQFISQSIIAVIQSFFSEKAVSYRHLHGLSHKPQFAVLVQELITGQGGVIFTQGDRQNFSMDIGLSPQEVVNGNAGTENFSSLSADALPDWRLQQVVKEALKVEQILNKRVDMEFVLTETGPIFLQMRTLVNPIEATNSQDELQELTNIYVGLPDDLKNLIINPSDSLRLILSEGIDIEQFQGFLFRWLVINKSAIKEIRLPRPIAMTSHFVNICEQLQIRISFNHD